MAITNPFAPPPPAPPPPPAGAPGPYNGPNSAGDAGSARREWFVNHQMGNGAEWARPGGTYGGNDTNTENTQRGSWLAGRYGGSMGAMNNELDRTDQGLARGMYLTGRGQDEQRAMAGIGAAQGAQGDAYTGVAGAYGANAAQDNRYSQADRANQQDNLNRLQQFYQNGPGPSAAQAQLQQGNQIAQNQNTALARSTRGGIDPTSGRSLAFQNAGQNQQTAQQAGILGAQEAADWRNQQGQAMGLEQQGLGAMRTQDLSNMGGNMQGGLQAGQLGQGYSGLGSNATNQGQQIGLGYSGTAAGAVDNANRLRNAILAGQSTADVSQYNNALGVQTQMNQLNAAGNAATMGAIGTGGAALASTVFGRQSSNPYSAPSYDPNAEYPNMSSPAGSP